MIRTIRNFIVDYWRLMTGRPLLGFGRIEIRGPAVDALERRKECDDGPSESEVTEQGQRHFRKFGPPDWSPELMAKVLEAGRESDR